MSKDNTFSIGICMAGAVSAGAYTAGVIDYLLETIENWQKAKELIPEEVPKHNILIEVFTGASAGGMTAAITAAAVQINFPHVNQNNYKDKATCDANPLYNSWVNLTEEEKKDMMAQLLSTNDILNDPDLNRNKEVRSGFNSKFIEVIANRTLSEAVTDPNLSRPYIADDFEILTTLTNLRGFEYEVLFKTQYGNTKHRMTMHRDFAHFQLNTRGAYNDDGKIPLHFNDVNGLNKNLLANAAMATGAFPVGLQPRLLSRDPRYINENRLLRIDKKKRDIVCSLYSYINVNVDGGIINNEPFELAEQILINRERSRLLKEKGVGQAAHYTYEKSASKVNTTVLMIDPFPNYEEEEDSNYYPQFEVKKIAPKIISAMRQQLMLKTDEVAKAFSDDDYSRFMIVPSRTEKRVKQKYSIACGGLGGFGGFFSKEFRIHDYMLGRRNCQRFLQTHFCIPVSANNPIIDFGYKGIESSFTFSINGKEYLPIIPDIRVNPIDNSNEVQIISPDKEEEFTYPEIRLSYLLGLEKQLKNRFGAVMSNIVKEKDKNSDEETSQVVKRIRRKSFFGRAISTVLLKPATRFFLFIGKYFGKGEAAELFLDIVIADMEKRGLLNEDV